jgi:CheY-like chemotaxis protein
MPVKILLADKSITIQKVVEMLFSGKEYEVTCVSDGESAFSEASRIVPDVVLADVDLPRIDGYSFAGRLRETSALANVPVILMLSRDDVYDAMKGKLAGLVDNIAKPFESQELIGKVKKALSAAPVTAPAIHPKPVMAPPKPVVEPPPPPRPAAEPAPAPPARPKESLPRDIFDIIEEAPARTDVKEASAPPSPPPMPATTPKVDETESDTFEVEPEYEVEPESEPVEEKPVMPGSPAPVAPAANEEEWGGVMDVEPEPEPSVSSPAMQAATDAFDTAQLFGREPASAEEAPAAGQSLAADASRAEAETPPSFDFSEPMPAEAEEALPLGQRAMDEMREGLGLGGDAARASDMHPDIVSFESLDMASRADHEDYTFAPPVAAPVPAAAAPASEPVSAVPPRFREASDEMLKGVAREAIEKSMREILERVAWEVIPDLAERLIREEIERLKAEQK